MPVLLLDNGDVGKGYGRQPELKYETAMKAMAAMRYAAVNVGEQDLLLGVDYLKYVADFASVPLLSANIVDKEGNPIFQPFALHKVRVGEKDVTAAVVGLISTSLKEEIESSNPGLVVEDYVSRLGGIIEQLRGEAGVIVLLAHMDEEEAGTLAERFPQADLIIASHSGDDPFTVPSMRADVPIVFAGTDGKNVGVVKYEVEEGRAKFSEYLARKLDSALENSPAMAAILEDYRQMVTAEKLVEAFPRVRHGEAQFTGENPCGECHRDALSLLDKDKHAHAFDALVTEGYENDPECVGCHTVGFGYKSGFISVDKTPDLTHVGCESCHGPGSGHIENEFGKGYGEVTEETCRSCHDLANSPNFAYEEYLGKLTPHHDSPLQG